MHLAVEGHQLYCVSQAAITTAVGRLRLVEIGKNLVRTNKQASINRVIAPQIFADSGHLVPTRLNFHRVVQIDNRIELAIYGKVEQTGLKVIKQTIHNPIIEN